MDNLRKKLIQCAKDAEGPVLAVYPFYYGFMESLDETELQAKTDKYISGVVGFYPAIYMIDQVAPEEMSSCKGELLGRPKPIPLCFLFSELEEVRQYRCKAFEGGLVLDQEKTK